MVVEGVGLHDLKEAANAVEGHYKQTVTEALDRTPAYSGLCVGGPPTGLTGGLVADTRKQKSQQEVPDRGGESRGD